MSTPAVVGSEPMTDREWAAFLAGHSELADARSRGRSQVRAPSSPADGTGWRALPGREEPEDVPEVMTFCPECARREFG